MSRAMRTVAGGIAIGVIAAGTSFAASPHGSDTTKPFLQSLSAIKTIGSTVPPNGDVNPYGIAIVAAERRLAGRQATTSVSNFNAKSNDQGTGTTIVQISTAGKFSLFADDQRAALPGSCPGGVGLTTALGHPPGRIRRGREPADNQRQVGNREVRLPDRARQSAAVR